MGIGKRIAEERKRRGLSQTDFAALLDLHLSTQRRYEAMTRAPSTTYLELLRKIGVDVGYILTGEPNSSVQSKDISDAVRYAISEMARRIGSSNESVAALIEEFSGHGSVVVPVLAKKVDALFDGCALELDGGLLAAILQGIGAAEEARQARLSPEKAAHAAVMLYRAFKASGKIDPAMIEEAVKLAS